MSGTKLELTWPGKNKAFELEPRILIEKSELSYGDQNTENMLIHGDNLLALKALEQQYTGKIKCIYIDPPYNTGSAFKYYDDGLEHSERLNLMKPRLELLKLLLKDNGTLWISIDADESHYLKVLCDEIFGRNNFVDEVVWQRSFSPINLKKTISRAHDTILIYVKNRSADFTLNGLPREDSANNRYKNPDNDPRGPRGSGDLSVGPAVKEKIYEITTPSGRKVLPPAGYCRRLTKEKFQEYVDDNRIRFGEKGDNVPRIKRFLSEVKQGITAMTRRTREEVGDNQMAKREIKALNIDAKSVFDTPKSEKLIERILTIGSDKGDLVLDSFLGSGTTCAVAHKMGRKWIGIELGDHCYEYCKKRLDLVIDGKDLGGITESQKWEGGGGYKFYELGPSVLLQDKYGNYIINPNFNSSELVQAICKIENFTYKAFEDKIKHGYSTEKDFIHITTRHITQEIIKDIQETSLKDGETMLIVAKTFESNLDLPDNIQIKKIPTEILDKCEYNKDNYSLPISEEDIKDED